VDVVVELEVVVVVVDVVVVVELVVVVGEDVVLELVSVQEANKVETGVEVTKVDVSTPVKGMLVVLANGAWSGLPAICRIVKSCAHSAVPRMTRI
jgi:hypothetical protein